MGGPIRTIFSIATMFLLVVLILRVNAGVWTPLNWAMLAASAICCMLVFVNFVYVFNYSYGLCCVVNAALIGFSRPSLASLLLASIMVIYGVRLVLFTRKRYANESYAKNVATQKSVSAAMPLAIKIMLWIQMALLMVFHQFAILFVADRATLGATVLAAAAIMLAGTVIEAFADGQKQAGKRTDPTNFIATGLFARCRHPNYTGEILLHVGLIVAGLGAVAAGWNNYAAVLVSPIYIIILMLSEASGKDRLQDVKYGDREDYRAYVQRTGSLLPRF